ncbi:MAG TPA: hypothetical protein VEQ18_01850, partial [Candidatus Nitrosocosmicus sp.]|nr:hypothetical protein [Candidatus Nitrosocosmicus sp.]
MSVTINRANFNGRKWKRKRREIENLRVGERVQEAVEDFRGWGDRRPLCGTGNRCGRPATAVGDRRPPIGLLRDEGRRMRSVALDRSDQVDRAA